MSHNGVVGKGGHYAACVYITADGEPTVDCAKTGCATTVQRYHDYYAINYRFLIND